MFKYFALFLFIFFLTFCTAILKIVLGAPNFQLFVFLLVLIFCTAILKNVFWGQIFKHFYYCFIFFFILFYLCSCCSMFSVFFIFLVGLPPPVNGVPLNGLHQMTRNRRRHGTVSRRSMFPLMGLHPRLILFECILQIEKPLTIG